MKIIQEAPINRGTRVFVALDIDVSLKEGNIQEPYRLEAGLSTIKYILSKGGFPVIGGHLGQPHGKYSKNLSTKQLFPYFKSIFGKNDFELLENLRFDIREEENSLDFAKELASKIDVYINENFATCHREQTSIVLLPTLIPSYAGFRLQKEIIILEKLKNNAKKPLVVIIGGAKLESKMPVISAFLKTADMVLLGSKVGMEWKNGIKDNLVIPIDYAENGKDIGEKTIEKYKEVIGNAKTILWAGPLGVYEEKEFMKGTKDIAQSIVSNKGTWSVVGGGDTLTALDTLGLLESFSFVSTGGSAMLEFLAKGTLPGIEVLK